MTTSYNGWPASKNPAAINVKTTEVDPGIKLAMRTGDVTTVLTYIAQQYNAHVEPLNASLGCYGYFYKPNTNNPTEISCHASGTAVDFNASIHDNDYEADAVQPNGKRNFTAAQIKACHAILASVPELDQVVHWGGDWHKADHLTPDGMHWEIHDHDLAKLARVANRIKELDMITDEDIDKIAAAVEKRIFAHKLTQAGNRYIGVTIAQIWQKVTGQ